MKKRIFAVLLTFVMVFCLLPAAALAAPVATEPDENGVVLNYEIASTPENGKYYTENESISFKISLTNTSQNNLGNVFLLLDGSVGGVAESLAAGATTPESTQSIPVLPEDGQNGEISIQLSGEYFLNDTSYTITETVTVPTGLKDSKITNLSAVRKDGVIQVSFESNCAGTYAYAILKNGETAPADWSGYDSHVMKEGINGFTVSNAPTDGNKLLLMAWNGDSAPMESPAEAEITDDIDSPEDGFNALTGATQLPYNGTVDLGGEGCVLYDLGGWYTYGQLVKVEAEEGQLLNLGFYGSSSDIDTVIEIYQKNGDTFDPVAGYNDDNKNGPGEYAAYPVKESGTYYLAFWGYDETETGLCSLEISASEGPEVVTLEDGFNALTGTTQLPYNGTVDLGGEGCVLYDLGGWYTYGQLVKVEAEEGQLLNLGFYGSSSDIDTVIEIYQKNGDTFDPVTGYDDDNKNDLGEYAAYPVEESGTYYLAFWGYDETETGLCQLNIRVIDGETAIANRLDFTGNTTVPTPGEEDRWSWDADTKTLTLKDGFSITGNTDRLISLPDGSTVIVEGAADIFNYGNTSIYGEGSLTIKGTDPDASHLSILYDNEDAIELDNDGNLTIENLSMDITAGSDGLNTEGTIDIENAHIKINANDEGIDPSMSVTIKDSQIEIYCFGKGIDASDDITVVGGTLIIDAKEEALEGDNLTFTGDVAVKLNTRNMNLYDLFDVNNAADFSLSGVFSLYGKSGDLLYNGQWSEDLMDSNNNLAVNEEPVYRIVSDSLHEHVFHKQVISEAYLASAATCTEPAKYYYSCECGEKGAETFTSGKALGHNYKNGICAVCGEKDPDYGTPATPVIIQGADGIWNKGNEEGLSFTSSAEYLDFIKVQVDGEDLDQANYDLKEGNTIVTLKAEYLETLSVGKHTLSIVSNTGTATTKFTIKSATAVEDTDSPQTGDNKNMALWFLWLLVSGTGAAVTVILDKKRRCAK